LVEITLRRDGYRLDIEIVDDGQEFDPFAQPEPLLDGDLESRPVLSTKVSSVALEQDARQRHVQPHFVGTVS
jgi:hypothetical protein